MDKLSDWLSVRSNGYVNCCNPFKAFAKNVADTLSGVESFQPLEEHQDEVLDFRLFGQRYRLRHVFNLQSSNSDVQLCTLAGLGKDFVVVGSVEMQDNGTIVGLVGPFGGAGVLNDSRQILASLLKVAEPVA